MTPSVTETQVMQAMTSFLTTIMPSNVEIRKAQGNLTSEPRGPDFVVLTPIRRSRLGTTIDTFDPTGSTNTLTEPMQVDMQLDFHGETSTDNATSFQIAFRDAYACDFLGPLNVAPLYCDDGNQMPFINDQDQFEDRWVLTASMQINPALTFAQQSANTLTVGLVEADGETS